MPRYSGVELPVFELESNPLQHNEQLREIAFTEAKEFIRLVGCRALDGMTLEELLIATEDEYLYLEDLTKTKVVNHGWGFVRTTDFSGITNIHIARSQAQLVPDGYALAARVPVIKPTTAIWNEKKMPQFIVDGCKAYNREGIDRPILYDIRPQQFMHGRQVQGEHFPQSGDDKWWYVDIEPKIVQS